MLRSLVLTAALAATSQAGELDRDKPVTAPVAPVAAAGGSELDGEAPTGAHRRGWYGGYGGYYGGYRGVSYYGGGWNYRPAYYGGYGYRPYYGGYYGGYRPYVSFSYGYGYPGCW